MCLIGKTFVFVAYSILVHKCYTCSTLYYCMKLKLFLSDCTVVVGESTNKNPNEKKKNLIKKSFLSGQPSV